MRGKKTLIILGYVAFSVATFLFFLYVTFPAQAVAQRMTHEVSKATGGSVNVTFGDVSLYRVSGIEAEDVTIEMAVGKANEELAIELDSLAARIRLLPLLMLDVSASIAAEVGEGSIDASVTSGDEGMAFDLEIDDLDFTKPPVLGEMAGIPINGVLAGKAKGILAAAAGRKGPGGKTIGGGGLAPEKSEAKASLTLRDAGFGPGAIKGFTVPAAVGFGQVDMAFDMERGRLRLASFQQTGGQVALKASGGLTVRRNLKASNLDTCLQFKFTDDAYLKAHPKVNTALQFAQVQLRKDGEGFMHVKLGGTVSNPRKQSGLCRAPGRK